MRGKTLFWLLIVVALAAGAYVYAWARLQSDTRQNHDVGPRTVHIDMPTPLG